MTSPQTKRHRLNRLVIGLPRREQALIAGRGILPASSDGRRGKEGGGWGRRFLVIRQNCVWRCGECGWGTELVNAMLCEKNTSGDLEDASIINADDVNACMIA